jgi:Phasin protein
MARSSKPAEGNANGKAEQPAGPAVAGTPRPGASTKRARSPSRKKPGPTPELAAPMPEAGPQVAVTQPTSEVADPVPPPLEAVVSEVAAGPATDALARALAGVERLSGGTVAFWQDHLERTMATGQAIMTCSSPQAAVALQMSYLQASLASGIAHAGNLARLSTAIARSIGPVRGR